MYFSRLWEPWRPHFLKWSLQAFAIYTLFFAAHLYIHVRWTSFADNNGFVLFDLILYVPSTFFQLNRDGSSWAEPVLSWDKFVLLKDHNAVTPVRLEPAAPRSRVKHSTTGPLRSLLRYQRYFHFLRYVWSAEHSCK